MQGSNSMWMRALSILALLGCGLHRARSDSASAAFSEAAGLRQSTIQQNDSRIFGIWEDNDQPKKRFIFECLKDSECTTPGFPICSRKEKECVQCRSDGDCNAQNPVCQDGTCLQCVSSEDCQGNPTNSVCNTVTNTCVPCNEASGCDPNSQATVCFVSAAQRECVQCVSDADCPDSLVCSTDRTCVACNTNTDCPDTSPVCDQDLNICVECSGANLLGASSCFGTRPICLSQVLNFVEEENARAIASAATDICVQCVNAANMDYTCASNQVCASTGGLAYTCVQCTNDGDCDSEQRPYCDVPKGTCEQCFEGKPCPDPFVCDFDANVCRSCLTDSDCVAKGGPNEFCDTQTYQCVGCLEDGDCGAGSFCESNICIYGCNDDQDCTSAAYPHCDTDINQCVECVQDTDCGSSSTKPFCDVTASRDQCVQCVTDAQCGVSLNPKCNIGDNTCVQCITNLDCIERGLNCIGIGVCQDNTCVSCTDDQQCEAFSQTNPVCDVEDNDCVECTSSSQCPDEHPICNFFTKRCVECENSRDCPLGTPICFYDGNFNECIECRDDGDCENPERQTCNPETKNAIQLRPAQFAVLRKASVSPASMMETVHLHSNVKSRAIPVLTASIPSIALNSTIFGLFVTQMRDYALGAYKMMIVAPVKFVLQRRRVSQAAEMMRVASRMGLMHATPTYLHVYSAQIIRTAQM
eukprot:jgi/Picre1/33797/NNA_001276.t1